ncbi:unnamed protein product, partial [Discosporangium mesarthrocarpum]
QVFRPALIIALDLYYQTTDKKVLEDLYHAINSAKIREAPRPTPWERRLMRRGVSDRHMGSAPVEHLQSKWTYILSFTYGPQTIQASVPLHTFPCETLNPAVTMLINLFGQSFIRIYNAVLTGQRVLFVGYNHAAGDVCKMVLAACALVSPPVEGILHRAFPYANLSDLSFLQVPGFVAGVTNPMFEARAEWWDLLCQLDLPNGTGNVTTSDERSSADPGRPRTSPGGGGGGPAVSGGGSSGTGNSGGG